MAQPAGLDGPQICDVGPWRADADPKAELAADVPCGQVFDSHRLEETVIHVPHITASAVMTVH
jgi:hypothetical protein